MNVLVVSPLGLLGKVEPVGRASHSSQAIAPARGRRQARRAGNAPNFVPKSEIRKNAVETTAHELKRYEITRRVRSPAKTLRLARSEDLRVRDSECGTRILHGGLR
jgi:hypothetical protein